MKRHVDRAPAEVVTASSVAKLQRRIAQVAADRGDDPSALSAAVLGGSGVSHLQEGGAWGGGESVTREGQRMADIDGQRVLWIVTVNRAMEGSRGAHDDGGVIAAGEGQWPRLL
jgi:hypothetical protein